MNEAQTSSACQTVEPAAPASGGEALLHRLRVLCALAIAAVVFWYVGWRVAGPVDPKGPVSLLLVEQGVITMAEMLGLAVVVSGLAVAVCGSGSAERGPLAVAIGLATLGLRGTQLDRLVMYRLTAHAEGPGLLDPFPSWALVAECWLWLALISVGLVVGRWVESWFTSPASGEAPTQRAVGRLSDLRQGLGSIVITGLVAWVVLSYTVGQGVDPILKGQIYFGVAAAFLLGALISHWLLRAGSRMWSLVAVAVVTSLAYAFGAPSDADLTAAVQVGTYVNIPSIARPLPLEFAAMGSVGILLEADVMRTLRAWFGPGHPDQR